MKKVLISTTVSGFVPQFEMNNVRILQEMGYEVHYATNYDMVSYGKDNHRLDGTGIIRHHIDYTRSPFQIKENIAAYRQLQEVMEQEQFELLHCHTPVAAVLSRLAARKYRKRGMKVVYTAHGFHFFKGASVKYWLLFYTVERFLANVTDVLITINDEDYNRAVQFCRRKQAKVEQLPGVGIDTEYWSGQALTPEEKQQRRNRIRTGLGLAEEQLALVSVGELIPRKNHSEVIRALGSLVRKHGASGLQPFRYFICGHGDLLEELKQLIASEGLEQQVILLDYQEDMRSILLGMDLFLFPSMQEGMPMALLEAVTAGLPVIARAVRGNRDIVKEMGQRGRLYSEKEELERLLLQILVEKKELFSGETSLDMSRFDAGKIKEKMKEIYGGLLKEKENWHGV